MKLSKLHKRRYINALKQCAKVNHLNKKGYMVFVNDELFKNKIILEDNKLMEKVSDNMYYVIFISDPELDNGLYDTIKEFNSNFKITAIDPKHMKKIN